jgi:hypothetical protein
VRSVIRPVAPVGRTTESTVRRVPKAGETDPSHHVDHHAA